MASMASSSVITLVTEAGSYRVWASFSYRISPVSFSMRTAEGAEMVRAAEPSAGAAAAETGRLAAASRRASRADWIRFMA